jgi:dienelactone hydrolase
MAEVLLFHHAQGLTPGVLAFADALRAGGHVVHTPDLFDGRTFGSIDEGMAHIQQAGFDALRERGVRVADGLPPGLVYAGFSFGVLPAQKLAQTRPGAPGRGAVPVPRRPALLRRQLAAVLRCGGDRAAHQPGARIPRPRLIRDRV